MEEDKVDVTDGISQFPEPILQHILSFLEVKDAFRISVLSKNWNNARATIQFLNFDYPSFFPSRTTTFDDDQEIFYQKVRGLLNVVDRVIMKRKQHNIDIQKFRLQLPNYNYELLDVKPYIEKFISSVTDGKIKELVFKVGDCHGNTWNFPLPEDVYAANSLNKVNLGGFKLGYSHSGGMIKLHSLQELYLSRTHVENQVFQLLMMGCPQLEILDAAYVYGLDHVQIRALLKLKSVGLYNCHRKLNKNEIETPNLEYLCHHGSGMLYVVNVAACRNLKALILHCLIINDKWVSDLFPNLPFLEKFSLIECWGLKIVSVSSNRLKELSLASCRSLAKVEVNAPNLSSFHVTGHVSASLCLEALAIKTIYFGIQSENYESEWHNKFVEFLGNFNCSKVTKMSSRKITAVCLKLLRYIPIPYSEIFMATYDFSPLSNAVLRLIVPKEMRKILPPLYNVKHLTVLVFNRMNQSMLLDLLDSLLWIAHRLDTLTLYYNRSKKAIQFTYGTCTDEEEDHCCESVPSKLWWQSLKKVECENFQDVEDQRKLKSYFIENGKMLDSIDGFIE